MTQDIDTAAAPATAPDIAEATVAADGGLRVTGPAGERARLHPLWLRERSRDRDEFDPDNRQRLFEPCELPPELTVRAAELTPGDELVVDFSDGARRGFDPAALAVELGWCADPGEPPAAVPWDATLAERPTADWAALDDPTALRELLAGFHRTGFCVVTGTPTAPGSLEGIAERFGFVRDTNFGKLFDVMTKPNPVDLAYTGRGLSAHADNPYRHPVPGIQLLHCLETTVAGGLSTLVDGRALVDRLSAEMPEAARALETVPVRFVYESGSTALESRAPMIEREPDGTLRCLRFSPRLDYVPPLDPATLELIYAGRRRLYELARDPAFEVRLRLEPGMLLMMDNLRLLHGRTAFDGTQGHRHLQGCYIDHDGPLSLYRMLGRGADMRAVGREVG